MLLQAKGWTTVVVVSLALGIGANTALFSAINGLLLRKHPGAGSGRARQTAMGGQERHGHELERLRVFCEG